MIKNYLRIAWRNLVKQKGLSFINVFGLSVGIGCFSLFMLYAVNELSFDNFHKNGNNIYRVYQWQEAFGGNTVQAVPYQPMPLGPAMKRDLPGIENDVRFLDNWGESFVRSGNEVLREKISFADPCFFTVFSFKLKYGDPKTALQDLHNIVLAEGVAEKIFGRINPIGKTIEIKEGTKFDRFIVSAVAENPPSNSTIQFSMLGNFNYFATTPAAKNSVENWHNISFETFLQLNPASDLPHAAKKLANFRKKYYPDEEGDARKNGWQGQGSPSRYGLQPLRTMHTDTMIDADSPDPKIVWILLGIAGGVLLIACINFTTLAIGRSAGRSKEVGVRKVIGGTKRSLAIQFLTETMLLAVLSAALGLLLADALLPYFSKLSERELHLSFTQFPQLFGLLVVLVLIVGLLAGAYPAWVLSSFKPIEVLRSKIKLGGSNGFTKFLVTIQFVVSAGLIISTVIIMQQLHYMQSKNPGFDKENIVAIDATGLSDTKKLYSRLKLELSSHPEILATASARNGLGKDEGSMRDAFKYNGKDKEVYEYFVDPDYIQVLGLQLLEGRNFNPAIEADTVTSVIINEAMMKDFGWTFQNAIGQRLKGYYGQGDPGTITVIGLVKNFNYQDFRQQVQPQMFQQFQDNKPYHFFVRLRPGNPSKALAEIQAAWKKLEPDYSLKYNFLDENLQRFYKSESRWNNIIGWAGGISIFLACLGLLGLTALAGVNRTKEIGIRKVLGASFSAIIHLLSKDFLRLVVIAFIVSMPIAWWFMNKWLQDYAYRIRIEWWVFALTGLGILSMAFLTVSFQAGKSAIANPVDSLRDE